MSDSPKVLVVLTSHDKLGDTGKPTGWYLPELAHPYSILASHGFDFDFASPKGGPAPVDPASVENADEESKAFYAKNSSLWEDTAPLQSFLGRADEYAALFYPGGHGPVFDLVENPTSQTLIQEFLAKGKVVAAVCHGVAALLGVQDPESADGTPYLKSKAVTGFSNAEEEDVGLASAVPFLLEDKLIEAVGTNGSYEKAEDKWAQKVVVDGKLITGQNPASAKGVAEAIVRAVWGA
ncbi:putative heat shock protein [Thermochaetoides thermophila DSM 1495]|uniref:D-lactate dehydratase n=1 Tax=Chaetomium thermophilum (strain DSM 1495 / CBS 144.50 / IMI 039719) TaxID=759272 RepID=G0S7D6_CHATD|nr:putative heat shock protein [Thermochaetoides thermophila DSM 1495]EGS21780.1 putative heat shock protein [Thermochaetoides thermophila DSM 1495]